jgi:transcriptional regulator with XRE-family HTH domain
LKQVKRKHDPYSKLKAYLNQINMSQVQLAQYLGLSKSALNQKMNGTGGDFTIKEVRAICTKLNISADEFFINPKVSNTKQNGLIKSDEPA